jgi:mono/diheme cytochrome c family protein
MSQKPADLRSDAVRKMSDDDLFSRITEGKQMMPGFAKKLSDEERRALVRYVRQLGAGSR